MIATVNEDANSSIYLIGPTTGPVHYQLRSSLRCSIERVSCDALRTRTAPSSARQVPLALTDPDSNENVPGYADRFGGDFMLTSQGDRATDLRPARRPPAAIALRSQPERLRRRLRLALVSVRSDPHHEQRRRRHRLITGPFRPGAEYVAVTPCAANSAPSTCPAPPQYPDNYFGVVDPYTGTITAVPVQGAALAPQGMLFVGGG